MSIDFRLLLTRSDKRDCGNFFNRITIGRFQMSIQGGDGLYSSPRCVALPHVYSSMELACFENGEWLKLWTDPRFADVTCEDDWETLTSCPVAPYLSIAKIQAIFDRMAELAAKPETKTEITQDEIIGDLQHKVMNLVFMSPALLALMISSSSSI